MASSVIKSENVAVANRDTEYRNMRQGLKKYTPQILAQEL